MEADRQFTVLYRCEHSIRPLYQAVLDDLKCVTYESRSPKVRGDVPDLIVLIATWNLDVKEQLAWAEEFRTGFPKAPIMWWTREGGPELQLGRGLLKEVWRFQAMLEKLQQPHVGFGGSDGTPEEFRRIIYDFRTFGFLPVSATPI